MRYLQVVKSIAFLSMFFCLIFNSTTVFAQIVLMGDNAPYENVNDGNFSTDWATWRKGLKPPFWQTKAVQGAHETPMALHLGSLFSMHDVGVATSKILDTHPRYQTPKTGDVINWGFGADLEYISDGRISLSLVFGEHERILANKVKLKGSDKIIEHFSGQYVISKEDADAGLPYVKATFYSSEGIKVYLHYVNISVVDDNKKVTNLRAVAKATSVELSWLDNSKNSATEYVIYRGRKNVKANIYTKVLTNYTKLGTTEKTNFVDHDFITGVEYTYLVVRREALATSISEKVKINVSDVIPPSPPTQLKAEALDAEILLSWQKNSEKDVVSYSLFRGDGHGKNQQKIADQIKQTHLTDLTPTKGTDNTYFVYAHDYSGNISLASKPIKARVKMVKGASFSDLILPMPITDALRTDLWGGDNVLPRDPNNGIEHPNWSYWGGRPVLGKDGKFHMVVTRWPANATKGHWEWPNSTVAYTVAKRPTGPYKVVKELAYDYNNGLGHNPDIILLNDGSYLLYSLVSWQPTLFHAQTMSGPWQRLGVMQVDKNTDLEIPARFYRFERNLSGVHLDNGQFLFVTKGGAMMLSEGGDPLGPYKVLTAPIQHNPIIPEKYRGSNYEDPVIWKDEVQYHMIINAFLDYRAIYLRSPDGINWKFNSGTAYTPNDTIYEDGTKTHWYKLERPHVITDQYGRATHLSVAVVDVPKRDDLARDKHSSKNIIMPLTVPKRLTLLSEQSYQYSQKNIKVVIQSEPGFNAHTDVNIASLRFGAAEEVDYGQGASVVKFEKQGKNLVVEFAKEGLGLTEQHFAGKLLGKTTSDELLIGFTRLPNFDFHPR